MSLLNEAQQYSLRRAENRRKTKKVTVREHKSTFVYPLPQKQRQRKRWVKVEDILVMIAASSDQFGVSTEDRQMSKRCISLLEDTFGGVQNLKVEFPKKRVRVS